MLDHSVFISYARNSSRLHADALHREMGGAGGIAFLDSSDIETLQKFPTEISDALLAAKVVVVFADETYFTRWYCLREFETAVAPFQAMLRRNAPSEEKEAALLHLVIALPESAVSRHVTDQLPPSLRLAHWPRASDTKTLAEVVRTRLEGVTLSIEQDLTGILDRSEAKAVGNRFREQAAVPPPANLRGIRLFPTQMPSSLDEGFKGRADDLWRLHHELSTVATGDAPRNVAIEGGGGFGKTRLAREYFHRFGPTWYRGGLFWLDANVTSEEIESRLHGILRALKPDAPDLKALRDTGKNARDELANALQQMPREAGVLFVVDNVPEPAAGETPKSLEELCPGVGVVTVLSTSRTLASLRGADVHPLNLDVLPPEAAVDLLTYGNRRAALDDEQWRSIGEWVGRLPLALELLQRAMQAAISPRELLELAKENRGTTDELDRLMAALRGEVPAGALRGITEAFDKSYQLLPEDAREAARLLACLAPQPIPLDVLKAMGDVPSSGAARAALINRSFITPPKTLGSAAQPFEIFGQMHKLLADFIRAKSLAGPAELRCAAGALIVVMAPDSCRNPAKWPMMNACLPHAELVFERLLLRGEREDVELAVRAGLGMGILQGAEGASTKARKVEKRTLALASKHLGPEDNLTLIAMGNLASTLSDQGELQGTRKLQEQVLDARIRVLGGDHPDTLTAMSNLAETLRAQGELEGGRKLQERVLDARTRILGDNHPDTHMSMNNLAVTLSDQGDIKGARQLAERVLEVRVRFLGSEHLSTLTAMSNLAETLRAQGDLENVSKLQKLVLDARTRILGGEHPHTLTSRSNFAETLSAQGDLDGARKLQESVLDTSARLLGDEHPDTISSMSNLAVTLGAQGDLKGARQLQEQVLDARTRILGCEHPHTLIAMSNLASTLHAQGDLEGAFKLEEQVLDTRIRVLGGEHPDTLTAMSNLAVTLSDQGDLKRARKLQKQVLDARARIFSEEQLETTISAWNLFSTLRAQGKTEEANTILNQNLRWLLKRAPETLSRQQREVRESLEEFLRKPQ